MFVNVLSCHTVISLYLSVITWRQAVEAFFITLLDCFISDEDELIGDHSKPYCLPIEKSASPFDLKCISPATVSHCYHSDMM